MEFLHPPHDDTEQVTLLLIVSLKGKTRLVWYEWRENSLLRSSHIQMSRHLLPPEEQLPLMLVPLTRYSEFMLVSEDATSVYSSLLTGTPNRRLSISLSARNDSKPQEPGSSKRLPLWTQWARPSRLFNSRSPSSEDAVYLCREDGIVQYISFFDSVIERSHDVCRADTLEASVDLAFATSDAGPKSTDLLIVGGRSGKGGLWSKSFSFEIKRVNSISNWAPLHNLLAVRYPNQPGNVNRSSQQRLFACTGEGKRSTIFELRYCHQASARVSTVIQGDAMKSGVLNVWGFHGCFNDGRSHSDSPDTPDSQSDDRTYLLISHPMQTNLLRVRCHTSPSTSDDVQINEDLEPEVEDVGLDLPAKTIFAATTTMGKIVHLTNTSVMISSLVARIGEEDLDFTDTANPHFSAMEWSVTTQFDVPDPAMRIVAASIHNQNELSIILLAVQVGTRFRLQLGRLQTKYTGEVCDLQSQPSCVHLQTLGHSLVAFVATSEHDMLIFTVDEQSLTLLLESRYIFEGLFAICDSIAVMSMAEDARHGPKYLLVCGLRDGSVQTLHWRDGIHSSSVTHCEKLSIGNTSVTALIDIRRKSRAFVSCDGFLYVLEYPQAATFGAPATIHPLWVANSDALQQGSLVAFTQIADPWLPAGSPGSTFGSLICVTQDQIHVLDLDESSRPSLDSRKIPLKGSPKRMVYSERLKKVIVLHELLAVSEAKNIGKKSNLQGVRSAHPFLAFLDPDIDVHVENDGKGMRQVPLPHGVADQITHITEWIPEHRNLAHHLLIVATQSKLQSRWIGSLHIYTMPRKEAENDKLELKKTLRLAAPVYSVAVIPNSGSFVYCCGSDLCLQSVDHSADNPHRFAWLPPVQVGMRVIGRHLTVHGSYIYVSSARESLLVFKYTENSLVYQCGDQTARDAIEHTYIPEHSLVLLADMTKSVVGLWQSPDRRIDNAMTTVFEAILPVCITGFQRITRPMWCRNPQNPSEDQTIIGSSEDGTILQLDILTKGWRVLRLIQNMAERNRVVCPFRRQSAHRRQIDPSTKKPHHMHINGDILQRVIEQGGEDLIREMLDAEPDRDSHTDFDSAEARWKRCKELASEVVDTEDENWFVKLVQWMRYRLRDAL
ncbi:hypothetical protein ACLMJK_001772 [Lecanora helva]